MNVTLRYEHDNSPLFTGETTALIDTQLTGAMTRAVAVVETNVIEHTPVGDSGFLRGSILGEVETPLYGVVGTNAEYAVYVEEGRKAGTQPPVEALLDWVRRSAKGRQFLSALRSSNRRITARQAAFILARKIGRRGTQGQQMFEKGLNNSTPSLDAIFDAAIDNILRGL